MENEKMYAKKCALVSMLIEAKTMLVLIVDLFTLPYFLLMIL